MVTNAKKVTEALDSEKEPEARWKLSFLSLVAGGMKIEEGAEGKAQECLGCAFSRGGGSNK